MYPKLFDLGPLPVYTYGLLLVTALLVAISLMARLVEKDGVDRNKAWDLGFTVIISAIVGAKLLLVITRWDYYGNDLSGLFSLEFLQAGGVYYGGFIGGVIGSLIFARMNPGLQFWTLGDAAAPAIALGQSIGRLGCFAAGCDYGKPTDLPWGVVFTSREAQAVVGVPLGVSLHPYQLYESAAAFGLFLALLAVFHRKSFRGQVLCVYVISYGVIRFGLEFLRGDADRGFVFGGLLSTSQFISLLLVPLAVICYVFLSSRKRA